MIAPLPTSPPSQMNAGDRITWRAGSTERAGNVWSAGPAEASFWVIPDGPFGGRKPALVVWHEQNGPGCYAQSDAAADAAGTEPQR